MKLPTSIRLRMCHVCVFLLLSITSLAQNLIIHTIAGGISGPGFSGDGGLGVSAQLDHTCGVAVDLAGNVLIADQYNNRIRKVVPVGFITTAAGIGPSGVPLGTFSGDGGPASMAGFSAPLAIATDTFGNIFLADNLNYRIRKINTSGIINTICGNGIAGYTGDGGQASIAKINYCHGITVDMAGNIYFGDPQNNVVRKINTSGIISTVAGNGAAGFSGDGGAATLAGLRNPKGLRVNNTTGDLYIADCDNNRIRKVTSAGIISTVAGGGTGGGIGIPATSVTILNPWDVVIDPAGNYYFTENGGHCIKKVNTAGLIYRVAGRGAYGYYGDGCSADSALLNEPRYLALDAHQNLFFSDYYNHAVRKVNLNHLPEFTAGSSTSFTMCMDTTHDLNSLLTVSDPDLIQDIGWVLLSPPANGIATVAETHLFPGGTSAPSSTWYTPTAGFTGTDAFSVRVGDCASGYDTITINVTVANCTLGNGRTKKSGDQTDLSVYPNPSSGTFRCNVTSGINEPVTIVVSNLFGSKVSEQDGMTNGPILFNTDLPPGIYFISAVTTTRQYNSKLIIK